MSDTYYVDVYGEEGYRGELEEDNFIEIEPCKVLNETLTDVINRYTGDELNFYGTGKVKDGKFFISKVAAPEKDIASWARKSENFTGRYLFLKLSEERFAEFILMFS